MSGPFERLFGPFREIPGVGSGSRAGNQPSGGGEQTRLLEMRVDRLALLCQALWELVREQLNLTDEHLEAMIAAVDERDGALDGTQREHPVRCGRCGRINSSRRDVCLYCGLEFQRDPFNL